MMSLNGQGVGTSSFEYYEDRIEDVIPESDGLNRVLEDLNIIQRDIEMESGEFTRCEGTGLYRLQSCLNHACKSNAIIRFPYNSARLQAVATRKIHQGEEITISYFDAGIEDGENGDGMMDEETDSMSLEERREFLLKYYLFECQCDMCCKEDGRKNEKGYRDKAGY